MVKLVAWEVIISGQIRIFLEICEIKTNRKSHNEEGWAKWHIRDWNFGTLIFGRNFVYTVDG
jgi:hypothetical protein